MLWQEKRETALHKSEYIWTGRELNDAEDWGQNLSEWRLERRPGWLEEAEEEMKRKGRRGRAWGRSTVSESCS